jgi:hypothetical protein
MEQASGGRARAQSDGQRVAAGLVAAAAGFAIASGFLRWAEFAPAEGASTTFRGLDLSAGGGSVACGVALVVVAMLLFARGARTGGRWASITAIVLSAVVLLAAGYSSVAPADALMEFQDNRAASAFGLSGEVAEIIEEGLARGPAEVTSLVGSWVATVGGLLGIVGGIVGVARAGRIRRRGVVDEPAPSIPPPPAGVVGGPDAPRTR